MGSDGRCYCQAASGDLTGKSWTFTPDSRTSCSAARFCVNSTSHPTACYGLLSTDPAGCNAAHGWVAAATSCESTEFFPTVEPCSSGAQVSSCSQGGQTSGGGDGGGAWGTPSQCSTGAGNFYICCGIAGGGCDSVQQYDDCCLNPSCKSGKIIACMANQNGTDVASCAAAINKCSN
jgi:hypothetical protein